MKSNQELAEEKYPIDFARGLGSDANNELRSAFLAGIEVQAEQFNIEKKNWHSQVEDKLRLESELRNAINIGKSLQQKIEALDMDRWMPISSAPKDGTEILVCNADRVGIGSWCENYRSGFPYNNWSFNMAYSKPWNPTHWQPLPPLPLPPKSITTDK